MLCVYCLQDVILIYASYNRKTNEQLQELVAVGAYVLKSVVIIRRHLIATIINMDVTGLCLLSPTWMLHIEPPYFSLATIRIILVTRSTLHLSPLFLSCRWCFQPPTSPAHEHTTMLLTCRSISFKAKWITFIARLASNVRGGRRKRQHGTTRNNDNHIHACHCTPSHYRKLVPVNNITKPEAPAMSSSSTDSNKIRTMLFRRNGCNASDLTDNDVKEEIDHLQRLYLLALDEVRGVVVMYERRKTRVTTTLMQQSHLHS